MYLFFHYIMFGLKFLQDLWIPELFRKFKLFLDLPLLIVYVDPSHIFPLGLWPQMYFYDHFTARILWYYLCLCDLIGFIFPVPWVSHLCTFLAFGRVDGGLAKIWAHLGLLTRASMVVSGWRVLFHDNWLPLSNCPKRTKQKLCGSSDSLRGHSVPLLPCCVGYQQFIR